MVGCYVLGYYYYMFTSLHLTNQIHKLLVVKLVLFCIWIPKSGDFILFDIIWIFIVIIKYKWYIDFIIIACDYIACRS